MRRILRQIVDKIATRHPAPNRLSMQIRVQQQQSHGQRMGFIYKRPKYELYLKKQKKFFRRSKFSVEPKGESIQTHIRTGEKKSKNNCFGSKKARNCRKIGKFCIKSGKILTFFKQKARRRRYFLHILDQICPNLLNFYQKMSALGFRGGARRAAAGPLPPPPAEVPIWNF